MKNSNNRNKTGFDAITHQKLADLDLSRLSLLTADSSLDSNESQIHTHTHTRMNLLLDDDEYS